MSAYTILVNTTDSFEDCWHPFFTLFKEYWPECNNRIILNTEGKDYSFPGLDITCSKVGRFYKGMRRPPWGWCLKKCLEQVDTEIVLYLQEDYFLNAAVNSKVIQDCVDYMAANNDCAHIGITHFGSHGPFIETENPLLWKVGSSAEYRISLQAGLWKKSSLLKYLKDIDTGWTLEIEGSIRAQMIDEVFLAINRDTFNAETSMVFPYIGTGIIRGKWNKDAVCDLFASHKINVDYSIRGFYSAIPVPILKLGIGARLKRKITNKKNKMGRDIDLLLHNLRS